MSLLYFLLTFVACIAAAAAGAFGMRVYAEHTRVVAEREDPRDTQIRDLQAMLKVAKTDADRARQTEAEAAEQLKLAREQLATLDQRQASATQKYETCKGVLKREIGEKNALRETLEKTERQLDRQRDRIEELQLEVSMQNSADDMLDPDMQAGEAAERAADADELPDIAAPELDPDQPSLIESLTQELERWKRHCHVLGAALREQRQQPPEHAVAAADDDRNEQAPAAAPADRLTEVRGIGRAIERKLHQLGIYRFAELAQLAQHEPEDAARLIPDLRSRMQRYDWVSQARSLHEHKYREAL